MALFLRFEVTIRDPSGYPHTQYHYYDDLADCRDERNRYIHELDDKATIGPIQQAITIWKDFEGTYVVGMRGVEQSIRGVEQGSRGVLPDEPFEDNDPEFDMSAFATSTSGLSNTLTTARNNMEGNNHE